jgi:hypothetical protein
VWWVFRKLFENDDEIIYEYGHENRLYGGRFRARKDTKELESIKLDAGDSEWDFMFMSPHARRLCFKEGAPDERMVAIG